MIPRYRHDYFEHIKEHGYEYSSHIPRHHGEEISLLTEIVTQNKKQDIFRKPKKHATNELTGFNNLKQLRSEEQTKRNSGKQNLQANLMWAQKGVQFTINLTYSLPLFWLLKFYSNKSFFLFTLNNIYKKLKM